MQEWSEAERMQHVAGVARKTGGGSGYEKYLKSSEASPKTRSHRQGGVNAIKVERSESIISYRAVFFRARRAHKSKDGATRKHKNNKVFKQKK